MFETTTKNDTTSPLYHELSGLIARVRHGDDCTANDLADRLLSNGLVDMIADYTA